MSHLDDPVSPTSQAQLYVFKQFLFVAGHAVSKDHFSTFEVVHVDVRVSGGLL